MPPSGLRPSGLSRERRVDAILDDLEYQRTFDCACIVRVQRANPEVVRRPRTIESYWELVKAGEMGKS